MYYNFTTGATNETRTAYLPFLRNIRVHPGFFCGLGVSQSLEFLTRVLQQTVNISLSTKCAHLLANLFFIRKKNSYTDVFTFGDYVDRIFPIELEIMDITGTDRTASYFDIHIEIDSEGLQRTKLYDKEMISIFQL